MECKYCHKEMTTACGCKRIHFFDIDRKKHKPIKVGDPGDWAYGDENAVCADCGAHYGHYHHHGCDNERCPICGRQVITCNCWLTIKAEVKEDNEKEYKEKIEKLLLEVKKGSFRSESDLEKYCIKNGIKLSDAHIAIEKYKYNGFICENCKNVVFAGSGMYPCNCCTSNPNFSNKYEKE